MKNLRVILAIALLATAACSDGTAPETPAFGRGKPGPADNGATAPACEMTGPLRLAPWAPRPTTYDTTFLAIQGRGGAYRIYFEAEPGTDPVSYMELKVGPGAEFVDPDGVPYPRGSIVPITVHADSTTVGFEFGPHGSRFSPKTPGLLLVSLAYLDLGSCTAADLDMLYQAEDGDPWEPLDTGFTTDFLFVKAPIYHFSNYAVAW